MKIKIITIISCVVLVVLGILFFRRNATHTPEQVMFEEKKPIGEQVKTSIDRGMDFLVSEQQPDGGYFLYSCDTTEPERCTPIFSAGFTAGILYALDGNEDNRARTIYEKGIPYVLEDMQETPDHRHAAWKVYAQKDERYPRVPADIDDTVIPSLMLLKQGKTILNDERSFDQYKNKGGLFYNWISADWNIHEQSRHGFAGGKLEQFPNPDYFGVDCVVNADALSYLAHKGEQPPQICSYLNDVVEEKLYPQCTFYYRSEALFLSSFMNARENGASCLNPSVGKIQDALLHSVRDDGTWSSNILSNMMSVTALIRTGYKGPVLDRAVARILESQKNDGGWENQNLFPDLYNPVFYGARSLVTVTAVHALNEYQKIHPAQ